MPATNGLRYTSIGKLNSPFEYSKHPFPPISAFPYPSIFISISSMSGNNSNFAPNRIPAEALIQISFFLLQIRFYLIAFEFVFPL